MKKHLLTAALASATLLGGHATSAHAASTTPPLTVQAVYAGGTATNIHIQMTNPRLVARVSVRLLRHGRPDAVGRLQLRALGDRAGVDI